MHVDLLWIPMDRVLFSSGIMIVSKNGIDPSGHASSTVNLMALSIELSVAGSFLCSNYCITKVTSKEF